MSIQKFTFRKESALTVIEMLTAIGIFMILAGIIVLRFEDAQKASRDAIRLKDIQRIVDMLETYYMKSGKNVYPTIGESKTLIDSKADNGWNSGDVNLEKTLAQGSLPVDPFSNSEGKKDIYYYTYCIDSATNPSQYVVMARLESPNKTAVEGGYKGTFGSCNCTSSGTETEAPYLYCVHSP